MTTPITPSTLCCPAPMPGRLVCHWIRHPLNGEPGSLVQLPIGRYVLICGSMMAVPQRWAQAVSQASAELPVLLDGAIQANHLGDPLTASQMLTRARSVARMTIADEEWFRRQLEMAVRRFEAITREIATDPAADSEIERFIDSGDLR